MAWLDYRASRALTPLDRPDHGALVLLGEGGLRRPGDAAMPHSDDVSLGYLPDCESPPAGRMLLEP
jgi:hypothetical protein